MRISFSPQGGKFWSSFADGCCNHTVHVGPVRDFAQTANDAATFALHLADAAGCDYTATSHVEDGHLKGTYSGCAGASGRNSGSFDLLSSDPSQNQAVGVVGNVAQSDRCTVTVTVKTGSGDPINGARLLLTVPGYAPQDELTDASGTHKFSAPVGVYKLSVTAKGYNDPGPMDFTLFPGATNAGGCSEVLTATLIKVTPTPIAVTHAEAKATTDSNALIAAIRKAETRYCKTAAQMACSYYMTQAGSCLSTALGSEGIYQIVFASKKAGFTSAQVVEQEAESHGGPDSDAAVIAVVATKIIDEHRHYDPGVFEMSILKVCLAGIAQ